MQDKINIGSLVNYFILKKALEKLVSRIGIDPSVAAKVNVLNAKTCGVPKDIL